MEEKVFNSKEKWIISKVIKIREGHWLGWNIENEIPILNFPQKKKQYLRGEVNVPYAMPNSTIT